MKNIIIILFMAISSQIFAQDTLVTIVLNDISDSVRFYLPVYDELGDIHYDSVFSKPQLDFHVFDGIQHNSVNNNLKNAGDTLQLTAHLPFEILISMVHSNQSVIMNWLSCYINPGDTLLLSVAKDISISNQPDIEKLNRIYNACTDEFVVHKSNSYSTLEEHLSQKRQVFSKYTTELMAFKNSAYYTNYYNILKYSYYRQILGDVIRVMNQDSTAINKLPSVWSFFDNPQNVLNDSMIQFPIYRSLLQDITEIAARRNRYLKADEYVPLTAQYFTAANLFDGKTAETYLFYLILLTQRRDLTTGEIMIIINHYQQSYPQSTYIDYVNEIKQKLKLSSPGSLAPDFQLEDIYGKTHKLSDFRGKIVYLHFSEREYKEHSDFNVGGLIRYWAEQYSSDDFQVIWVSTNMNAEQLRKSININQKNVVFLTSENWTPQIDIYNQVPYRNTYLIDENGRFALENTPTPGEIKNQELVDNLIKQKKK